MKKTLGALISVLAVSACASGPTMQESGATRSEVAPGMSEIVVYRKAVYGAAIQPMIKVDGQNTKRCTPKGAFVVQVPDGVHSVAAATEVRRSVQVDTRTQDRAYVRCSIGFGLVAGRPKLEVVPTSVGESESATLSVVQ